MSYPVSREKELQFLKELTELTQKHGIAIGGCGCCGSPFLYDDEGQEFSQMQYHFKLCNGEEMIDFDFDPKGKQ